MDLRDIKNVYFLGIGGIGMSAIARYLLSIGKTVYGYDRSASEITQLLISEGAIIQYSDEYDQAIEDVDVIIYTPAIPADSKLLQYYKNHAAPLMKRSEALGLITKDKKTIAVSGSHGKTTVSAMVSFLLKECGIDCSAFLGGISANFNSNYVYGASEYVVVEADEFDRSFMRLSPDYVILTSIDTDHLDIYGTKENIVASFQEFIDKLDEKGVLIVNENYSNDVKTKATKYTYGFEQATYVATHIVVKEGYSTFSINGGATTYRLNFNGRHNIENAVSAISLGLQLGIDEQKMSMALEKFKGIKRRFETLFQSEKYIYIDDYAHHPTEIKALLSSVKEIYASKRVLSIFQPHLYSRTQDLHLDFAKALDISDDTLLLEVYPARELPIEGVSSKLISENMNAPVQIVSKDEVLDYVKKAHFDILLTIGAGDINLLNPKLIEILHDK